MREEPLSRQTALPGQLSLEQLWNLPAADKGRFNPDFSQAVPESAQLYLKHAIASGIPLASAVRLQMHGEIKLQSNMQGKIPKWWPFTAQQVIRCDQSMIWRATVRMYGIPIKGFDCLVGGAGAMSWKLLGMIPIVQDSGPDVSRSARGRVAAESVWLPSLLCESKVALASLVPSGFQASIHSFGLTEYVNYEVEPSGQLVAVDLRRWGNPEGHGFHYNDFGGVIEEERTFEGYTIPTRLRVGWHYRNGQFGSDGEFFRVNIDHATFK